MSWINKKIDFNPCPACIKSLTLSDKARRPRLAVDFVSARLRQLLPIKQIKYSTFRKVCKQLSVKGEIR